MRDTKSRYKPHKMQHLWGKYRVNRKYKDRLFRLVFKEKKDLLQLYNAINDTEYQDEEMLKINTLEDAADRAVHDCIAEGILADILKKNQAEVRKVILTEYDEDWHIENEKRDSFAEGMEIGHREGMEIGQRKGMEFGVQRTKQEAVNIIIAICQEFYLSPEEIKAKIKEKYGLSDEEANVALEAFESHNGSTA